MTKKNYSIFFGIIFVIAIVGILNYLLCNKNLSVNDSKVLELYSYLGNDSITICDGSIFYSENVSNYSNAEESLLICNAYLYSDREGEVLELDTVDGVCSIDDMKIAPMSDIDACQVTKYEVGDIEQAYLELYGNELTDYEPFVINTSMKCSYNEKNLSYYCYYPAYEVLVSSDSSKIYRLIKNVIEETDGTILIRDYFIYVKSETCYTDLDAKNKNDNCTIQFNKKSDLVIDTSFMKNYGTLYEHTFEYNDGNYYWINSEKIS
ncbi:MAG: hypothetical protein R3Y13_00135 [bacterium]